MNANIKCGILTLVMKSLYATCILFTSFALISNMNAAPDATNAPAKTEIATFGGGCFWCAEAVFLHVPGVVSVTSGYAGGTTENPTYKQVCTGTTGHAEVIQLKYDPAQFSYEKILEVFWEAHDPTTLNAQGNDHGTQYRWIGNSDADHRTRTCPSVHQLDDGQLHGR